MAADRASLRAEHVGATVWLAAVTGIVVMQAA